MRQKPNWVSILYYLHFIDIKEYDCLSFPRSKLNGECIEEDFVTQVNF